MPVLWGTLALAALYVVLSCPRIGRDMSGFAGRVYAHRGVHDNSHLSENTLAAFEEACQQGYGIELDVRLSRDGELVVFHDDTLERACGDGRRVEDMTLAQLREMSIFGGGEIPTFDQALECIAGRGPLIVEIKTERRYRESTRKTVQRLREYQGPYCVESFNPFVLRELRRVAPEILRGQLATGYRESAASVGPCIGFLLANLLTNGVSRPDFIAYNVQNCKSWALLGQRKLFHTTIALWTIRSQEQKQYARKGDMLICEWFQ